MNDQELLAFGLACAAHGDRVIKSLFGFIAEADPVKAAKAINKLDRLTAMRQLGSTTGILDADQDAALKARITELVNA